MKKFVFLFLFLSVFLSAATVNAATVEEFCRMGEGQLELKLSDVSEDGKVIVTVFDNGVLTDVKICDISAGDKSCLVEMLKISKSSVLKCFSWNGLDKLSPIGDAAVFQAQEIKEKILEIPGLLEAVPSANVNGVGDYVLRGDLVSGDSLETPITNIKKNNRYTFMCRVDSLKELKIGHGKTEYSSSYLSVTPTKISVTNYYTSAQTVEYEHGLTIGEHLYVDISVGVGVADVTLFTGSDVFTVKKLRWDGDSNAASYAECVDGELRDCVFTWTCGDLEKSIYAFGDSYFGMSNTKRWVYYLKANGYLGNLLLNGYPGQSSTTAIKAFDNIIQLGKPLYAIWCLGMNDGSDTADSPSQKWRDGVEHFIEACNENQIIPILATVPTVPTVNNEQKNAYVRQSGYRYIDFASAVGATPDGVWHEGMLSSDGIHPDTEGAKALYAQVLTDFPEIKE